MPSGSALRKRCKPAPYKYAAEMDFLEPVTVIDPTTDMTTSGRERVRRIDICDGRAAQIKIAEIAVGLFV